MASWQVSRGARPKFRLSEICRNFFPHEKIASKNAKFGADKFSFREYLGAKLKFYTPVFFLWEICKRLSKIMQCISNIAISWPVYFLIHDAAGPNGCVLLINLSYLVYYLMAVLNLDRP